MIFKKIGLFFGVVLLSAIAIALDTEVREIEIREHKFYPDIVEVAQGFRIKLIVHNKDKTVEEFESHDLKREKIVPPGKKVNIILPPLKPGKYYFFGEFHEETAKGYLIVK